jgi:hypothetical protein
MNRRLLSVLIAAFALMVGVGGVAAADQPGRASSGHACHGIENAYSHASSSASDSLHAVADKLGCDLSGVEPAQKHDKPDSDKDDADDADGGDHADRPDHAGKPDHAAQPDFDEADDADDADDEGGPDVAAMCAKIAGKLADAEARARGKSGEAFGRQADHWECDEV